MVDHGKKNPITFMTKLNRIEGTSVFVQTTVAKCIKVIKEKLEYFIPFGIINNKAINIVYISLFVFKKMTQKLMKSGSKQSFVLLKHLYNVFYSYIFL